MTVAICLSGQPRTFRTVARNILEVFEPVEGVTVDFFIHTWLDNDSYTVHKPLQKIESITSLEGELTSYYHPKRIEVENRLNYPYKDLPFNCQMHSTSRSIQLVQESGRKYDWIVWTRLDILRVGHGTTYSPLKVNWSELCRLDSGKFSNCKTGDDFKFPNDLKDKINNIIFSPHNFCKSAGWARGILHLNDWTYFGKPTVMFEMLGKLEKALIFCETFEDFFSKTAMYEFRGMSMEIFLPIWAALNRVGMFKNENFIQNQAWIYRPYAEKLGIDPYSPAGFGFLRKYENYPDFHLLPLPEIEAKWIHYVQASTNSGIRKRNKSSEIV